MTLRIPRSIKSLVSCIYTYRQTDRQTYVYIHAHIYTDTDIQVDIITTTITLIVLVVVNGDGGNTRLILYNWYILNSEYQVFIGQVVSRARRCCVVLCWLKDTKANLLLRTTLFYINTHKPICNTNTNTTLIIIYKHILLWVNSPAHHHHQLLLTVIITRIFLHTARWNDLLNEIWYWCDVPDSWSLHLIVGYIPFFIFIPFIL